MDEIKILNTTPYRTATSLVKMDRIKVELDLPITSYTELRKIIEGSHLYKMTEVTTDATPKTETLGNIQAP